MIESVSWKNYQAGAHRVTSLPLGITPDIHVIQHDATSHDDSELVPSTYVDEIKITKNTEKKERIGYINYMRNNMNQGDQPFKLGMNSSVYPSKGVSYGTSA